MDKKSVKIIFCISLVLILSLSLVSAGWFDWLGRITGRAGGGGEDSDGGLNYFEKGTCENDNLKPFTDSCINATHLKEYYPEKEDCLFENHFCGIGYECSGDKCVSSLAVDTDVGGGRYLKGTCTNLTYPVVSTSPYTDICLGNGFLREFFNNSNKCEYQDWDCSIIESGKSLVCLNGRCTEVQASPQNNGECYAKTTRGPCFDALDDLECKDISGCSWSDRLGCTWTINCANYNKDYSNCKNTFGCAWKCFVNTDCVAGTICDANNKCVATTLVECSVKTDCSSGEICNYDKKCVIDPNAPIGVCMGGTACFSKTTFSTCIAAGEVCDWTCYNDNGCSSGQTCSSNGICQSSPSENENNCGGSVIGCEVLAKSPCISATGCDYNYNLGGCFEKPCSTWNTNEQTCKQVSGCSWMICGVDADCPGGYGCSGGKCVLLEGRSCASNKDCSLGQTCIGTICRGLTLGSSNGLVCAGTPDVDCGDYRKMEGTCRSGCNSNVPFICGNKLDEKWHWCNRGGEIVYGRQTNCVQKKSCGDLTETQCAIVKGCEMISNYANNVKCYGGTGCSTLSLSACESNNNCKLKVVCSINSPCPSDSECIEGTCITKESCEIDKDCEDYSYTGSNPFGMYLPSYFYLCEKGVCERKDKLLLTPCSSSECDLTLNERCYHYVCLEPECLVKEDCSVSGEYDCVGRSCVEHVEDEIQGTQGTCSETDGGPNYYLEGTCTDASGFKTDSYSDGKLSEYWCSNGVCVIGEVVECEQNKNGKGACALGEGKSSEGCELSNGKFIKPGMRYENSYCDPLDLILLPVRSLGGTCVSDYQCKSNVCIGEICTSIRDELVKQGEWLKKIWCWISNLASSKDCTANPGSNYCVCLNE